MGKCDFSLPSWSFYRIREYVGSHDLWDIAGLLFQIPLQTLFLLGTALLTLQIFWMKIKARVYSIKKNVTTKSSTSTTYRFKEHKNLTLKELRNFNGVSKDKIYVAINGKIFDVSSAKTYYGPKGAYSSLAGRDASRAFATFSLEELTVIRDETELDDLSDLNPLQLDSLQEWEIQFIEKYTCVGKLVRYHEPKRLEDLCQKPIICRLENSITCVHKLPLPTRIKHRLMALGKTNY